MITEKSLSSQEQECILKIVAHLDRHINKFRSHHELYGKYVSMKKFIVTRYPWIDIPVLAE
ncbi:MAG: hypothetical protein RIC35_02715 [Marinoscillum sp.]